MARRPTKDPAVELVCKCLGEARDHHATFIAKVEHRYKAYRGLMEARSDAAKWTSKLHPPYIMQIVETMLASTIDANPRFRVRPRPHAWMPGQAEHAFSGAENLERLLNYELEVDRFAQKQRPHALQALITGMSVLKTSWRFKEGIQYGREYIDRPVLDSTGLEIGTVPMLTETQRSAAVIDDPTVEVRDVRDFFWPEYATSAQRAPWLIDRVWLTPEELKAFANAGIFNKDAVDQIKVGDGIAAEDMSEREMATLGTNRTKGLVEVLEYWTETRVITVANRAHLLSDKANPFQHGEKPFIVTSAQPDLFVLPGMSVVEQLAHLQEMLWTLMNQRIDSLRLLNNAIVLLRSDVDDPDAFEWAPGAQWYVEDPDQVKILEVPTTPAEISLQAEQLLKGDLQNITGGMPFASGTQTSTVDQKTATGVSIITSLAQRILQSRKQHFLWSYGEVGHHFAKLLQQFMSDERSVMITGADGKASFLNVSPDQIQGEFDVTIEVEDESLMRQERRAEAQALVQIAGQLAPVFAAVGQPLNLKAFMDKLLLAFDEPDAAKFYSAQPAALGAGAPQNQLPPGQGGAPPGLPAGPGGVTAPQSIDPAVSPSNQTSMSPEVFNARALAASGGGPNNGGM